MTNRDLEAVFQDDDVGTFHFHKISAKDPPVYVAEFQFRYSNRGTPNIFGEVVRGC
jgi:hypothetical protein